MLVSEAVWYAPTFTCLTCGDAWSDGERLTRPFAAGWRASAVARARRRPYAVKTVALANLRAEIKQHYE